jgi:tetratricopeptide (TPR) repeat protein
MGRLHNGHAWEKGLPDVVVKALESWLADKGFDLHLDGWFTDGRSGSPVARVVRVGREKTDRLVLKFSDTNRVSVLHEAWEDSYSFQGHLAQVEGDTIRLGSWRAVFMRIAGDLHSTLPLARFYDHPDFASHCATIVQSAVADWNGQTVRTAKRATAEVLDMIFGHRRDGAREWAESQGIAVDGSRYAELPNGWPRPPHNPFALTADNAEGRRLVEHLIVGKAHGDLSCRNILVPTEPALAAESFVLIDYDRFSGEAPLARDPMHLLVALALDRFDSFAPVLRKELADVLVHPDRTDIPPELVHLRAISEKIHSASRTLASREGFGDQWVQQCRLSLVGVGLVHLGRRLYTRDQAAAKKWCFYLAAVATEAYLRAIPTHPAGIDVRASMEVDVVRPDIEPTSLVNRTEEMKALRKKLVGGPGGVVVLRGTRGVGKTALVEAALTKLKARRSPPRVHRHVVTTAMHLDARTLIGYVVGETDTSPPFRQRGSSLVQLEAALRGLGNSRVVIALDSAENLVRPPSGELGDPELDDVLEMIAADGSHRVTVLLVTRHDLGSPAAGTWSNSEPLTVNKLPFPEFHTYLARITRDGSTAIANLPDESRRLLHSRLQGNPRLAELAFAIVGVAENGPDLPALIGYLSTPGASNVPRYLTDLLLDRLSRPRRRVLEALAAFDTPVPESAVVALLGDKEAGTALSTLAAHRVVYRADGEQYFLPPEDGALILAAMPNSAARSELFFSAATALTPLQNKAPRRVSDLRVHFAELRALLRSGEHAAAYDMIQATNDVLRDWNLSSLLLDQRKEVRGSLGDDFLEMANENALGHIHVSMGRPEDASDAYGRALHIANRRRDDRHRLKIYASLAAMYWERNDTDRALGYFALAKEESKRLDDPVVRMGALEGEADCHRRRGHYDQAIRYGHEALAAPDLVDYPDTVEAARFANSRSVTVALKLARWYGELGRADYAARFIEVAHEAAARHHDNWLRASCLDGRADMFLDRGEFALAELAAGEAEEQALRFQDPITLLQARTTLCLIYLKTQRPSDARRAIDSAWRYRHQTGRSLVVLALRALTIRQAGDDHTADRLFRMLDTEATERIEHDPGDFAAFDFLGFARCGLVSGDDCNLDDAVAAFRTARRLTPPTPVLVERLRFMLRQLEEVGLCDLGPAIDALADPD